MKGLKESGSYNLAPDELSLIEQYTYECEAELLIADACCECLTLTEKAMDLCEEPRKEQKLKITDAEREHILPISPAIPLLRQGIDARAMTRIAALQPSTRPEVISMSSHPQYYMMMEQLSSSVYALLVAASTADRSRLVGLKIRFSHLVMNPAL